MSVAQILVTASGLLAIAGVAWFFWGPRGDAGAAKRRSPESTSVRDHRQGEQR